MGKDRTLTPEEQRLWKQAMGEEPVAAAEKKSTAKNRPDVGPRKTEPKPPLAVESGRMAARILKPRGAVEATLDLHGLAKLVAYERVAVFIKASAGHGLRHVIIITGKGKGGQGVLRAQLPYWLNEPGLRPYVSGIAEAAPHHGGGGVLHVLLKARYER